ncbi:ABC transporter permease subunit [Vibrio tapetis subsp. quintayensis]|uniref:ABC transporter permease n=1 Tax=Vibrio tapetis TaxID=52443 RepID=UPI0025B4E0C4|nr:ABC transporter permease subunit [Vibrio tapetis]MDN3682484.1 ABC transporter permease subunit [Vibrio tapetis subsp. quintayensis]
MLVYIIRRLNLFIITLLFLSLIGYSILRLDPTSPAALSDFGQGWFYYLSDISQFNFGMNQYGEPIWDDIKVVFPATLELCFFAFIIALIIGLPLGTVAGTRQGKWVDTVISFISMSGYSAPLFWVALMLIMFFSLDLGWFPVAGRYDLLYQIEHVTGFAIIDALISTKPLKAEALQSVLEHLMLPCIVLALAPTTQIIVLMRASVAEVMQQNYIRAAKINGLSKYEIVIEHAIRNALPPIIPKFGVQLSSMITFAVITESIFNWPGIGRWLLDALSNQDYVAIQAGVMVVAVFVLMANILSDLVGAIANPLIRKEWYAVR